MLREPPPIAFDKESRGPPPPPVPKCQDSAPMTTAENARTTSSDRRLRWRRRASRMTASTFASLVRHLRGGRRAAAVLSAKMKLAYVAPCCVASLTAPMAPAFTNRSLLRFAGQLLRVRPLRASGYRQRGIWPLFSASTRTRSFELCGHCAMRESSTFAAVAGSPLLRAQTAAPSLSVRGSSWSSRAATATPRTSWSRSFRA